MNKSSRLVFFGTEDFSHESLEQLLRNKWSIEAVVTKPDSRSGRGKLPKQPRVKTLALKHNIAVFQPEKISEISDQIINIKPSHGVLVAYGKIIPQAFIDLFPGGIINLHPSLLPLYRGPAPIEAAIINGDSKTGVSLMELTAKMDAGPVYAQAEYKLKGNENQISLYDGLAKFGAQFLCENLQQIINGLLKLKPQDDSKATYTKLLKKDDGLIDWNKPADLIERQIRAFLNYPKSTAILDGNRVIITKARVAQSTDDGLLVLPCHDSWLEILELVGPNGTKMSGADYIRGYRKG